MKEKIRARLLSALLETPMNELSEEIDKQAQDLAQDILDGWLLSVVLAGFMLAMIVYW